MTKQRKENWNHKTARVLVLDDERDMLVNYERMLRRAGHDCLTSSEPLKLPDLISEYGPDLVITDLRMPGKSGIEVLEEVHNQKPYMPVIIITAHGTVESAVDAMKRQATDYLTKPFAAEELLGKIQKVVSQLVIDRGNAESSAETAQDMNWRQNLIGVSPAFHEILDLVRKVARTDVNVLVTGESGTGKEVVARAIHDLSQRRTEIFVPVDCASLPETLLESELFGYRKGAFTGASSDKMGLFEFAHRGTLFLDEIGEMPLSLQSKLLRVLQERRFRPIGARDEIDVDVRVIAATNIDLSQATREKTFRSDLYFRLNVISINLPSMRRRREDIPLLVNHFLRDFISENNCSAKEISSSALAALHAYDWPGNVREIQNVVEHAATLASGPVIQLEDLPEPLRHVNESELAGNGENPPSHVKDSNQFDLSSSIESQDGKLFASKGQIVSQFEREYLMDLLVQHNFNISKAAKEAGCHRRTLYRMIHRHNIDLKWLKLERRKRTEPSVRTDD